jgi:hypothetical protein
MQLPHANLDFGATRDIAAGGGAAGGGGAPPPRLSPASATPEPEVVDSTAPGIDHNKVAFSGTCPDSSTTGNSTQTSLRVFERSPSCTVSCTSASTP